VGEVESYHDNSIALQTKCLCYSSLAEIEKLKVIVLRVAEAYIESSPLSNTSCLLANIESSYTSGPLSLYPA